MIPLRLLRDAEDELVETAKYYERCSAGLGASFVDEIQRTFALIQTYPEAGRVLGLGYRRLLVHRFPYSVVYRTESGAIVCVAIAHDRREPGYWRRRTRRDR